MLRFTLIAILVAELFIVGCSTAPKVSQKPKRSISTDANFKKAMGSSHKDDGSLMDTIGERLDLDDLDIDIDLDKKKGLHKSKAVKTNARKSSRTRSSSRSSSRGGRRR